MAAGTGSREEGLRKIIATTSEMSRAHKPNALKDAHANVLALEQEKTKRVQLDKGATPEQISGALQKIAAKGTETRNVKTHEVAQDNLGTTHETNEAIRRKAGKVDIEIKKKTAEQKLELKYLERKREWHKEDEKGEWVTAGLTAVGAAALAGAFIFTGGIGVAAGVAATTLLTGSLTKIGLEAMQNKRLSPRT